MSNLRQMLRYHEMAEIGFIHVGFDLATARAEFDEETSPPVIFVIPGLERPPLLRSGDLFLDAYPSAFDTGEAVIKLAEDPAKSSEFDYVGGRGYPGLGLAGQAVVARGTVDIMLAQRGMGQSNLRDFSLNLNLGGAELSALSGMRGLLPLLASVFVECHRTPPYRGGADYEGIRTYLDLFGFRPRYVFLAPGAHASAWFVKTTVSRA